MTARANFPSKQYQALSECHPEGIELRVQATLPYRYDSSTTSLGEHNVSPKGRIKSQLPALPAPRVHIFGSRGALWRVCFTPIMLAIFLGFGWGILKRPVLIASDLDVSIKRCFIL
jgi:hypothetical protein